VVEVGERYTGARVKRVEDRRILTGHGRYVDDVVLPGMLHVAFVRSPFAHARITSVDVEAARQAPGVVAVVTSDDLQPLLQPGPIGMAALMGGGGPAFTVLAGDKVRVVGDPVVMVVAESRYLAEDACELVEVDYDELPPVASVAAASDPANPPIFEDQPGNLVDLGRNTYGDVDGAFARADRVVRAHLDVHRHQNVPMEGRGIVADFDPATGRLRVHASCQGVGMVQRTLAAQLGLDQHDVRVTSEEIGGSFGLKFGASREEIAVAAASKLLGRPVKWIEDRSENLAVSGQAREESFDVEAAVTADGVILALEVKMALDAGAYPGMGTFLPNIIQNMIPGPYRMEGLSFETVVATTNKASYVAYRGPWASETFVRERIVDLVAGELGLDPVEVRRRNVAHDADPAPTMVTGRSLRGVTAAESIERILEVVDVAEFRRRQAAARADGRYLGLGMATYIEGAPGPRGDTPLGRETMRAAVDTEGTVLVFTGQMPHGQGHQTTFAQVAADQLGVPFEQVRVVVGDTDVVPMGFTGGSRAATMAGGASLTVARALKQRILDLGADVLEASVDDLELAGGSLSVRGVPASALTLAELASTVAEPGRFPEGADTALEVEIVYDGGQGGWAGGTHCAEVEVDVDTGLVHIHRYVVAEDCGELINPSIVEGQVRGGVAQGIGAVLLERSAYDDNGQFLAGSFMDYLLPTTTEVPTIEIEHLETTPLDPDVNFRGVGEGGMIVTPPTLCNAIEDALAPFGVKVLEQHLPPSRLLELIGAIEPER
jgi:carbon-monoxide dehydrogenase large subunit